MARINIDDETRNDPRFVVLGKKLGTTKFDARGRMEEIWAYCTEKQLHCLSVDIIDACAQYDGFSALIILPEVSLAERTEYGIRIKGTHGRIEWLEHLRTNGKKGGRPKDTKQEPGDNQKVIQTITRQEPEGYPDNNQKVNQNVTRSEPDANPLTLTLCSLLSAPVLSPALTLVKKEKNNNSSNSKTKSQAVLDFEALYANYPRKEGKTPGRKVFQRDIKTQEDYDKLSQAIDRYALHVASQKIEKRFVKHFGTFMHQWTDWLETSAGQVVLPPGGEEATRVKTRQELMSENNARMAEAVMRGDL